MDLIAPPKRHKTEGLDKRTFYLNVVSAWSASRWVGSACTIMPGTDDILTDRLIFDVSTGGCDL